MSVKSFSRFKNSYVHLVGKLYFMCCLGFGLCSVIIFGSDKLYLVFNVYLVCTTSGQWSGFKVYLLSFIILY